ncbi:hypothetical protein PkoCFBP13504_06010 [Pseudomonas koreensis]|jgi:uncharacterized membrane protein|uniref:hypothetical protein n=1 Tax=Pseudomonas TaxID=286 RepID=UPI0010C13EA4|nr:hypothetical protein [Pseudomonas koreensis]TKJ86978.1 hypothetical protein PkoCFBP13504_06010 [Pseudomonas koreensis]
MGSVSEMMLDRNKGDCDQKTTDNFRDALNELPKHYLEITCKKQSLTQKKLKKRAITAFVVLLTGVWTNYFFWAATTSSRTILMPEIPELTTYLLIGAIFGGVFAVPTIRAGKTAKRTIESFSVF